MAPPPNSSSTPNGANHNGYNNVPVRPAGPDMPRPRGNSIAQVVPALPAMSHFQGHHQRQQVHHQQQQYGGYHPHHHPPPHHGYPQHPYQHHPHPAFQQHRPSHSLPHHPPPPVPQPLNPQAVYIPRQQHIPVAVPPPPPPQAEEPAPPPPPPPPPPAAPVESMPVSAPVRSPFRPPLPWYSDPDSPFPHRRKTYRKKWPSARPRKTESGKVDSTTPTPATPAVEPEKPSAATSVSGLATPPMSAAPSEADSTHPTTPSSTAPPSVVAVNVQKSASVDPTTPAVVPAVPVAKSSPKPKIQPAVPAALPKVAPKKEVPAKEPVVAKASPKVAPAVPTAVTAATTPEAPKAEEMKPEEPKKEIEAPVEETPTEATDKVKEMSEDKVDGKPTEKPATPPKPIAWANLFKKDTPKTVAAPQNGVKAQTNGNYGTLEEALRSFSITPGEQLLVPFLLPRGLVNTGNMCFMNAILQMLLFCGPFYHFLERVAIGAKSIKNNTPLIEMMITFMREFRVITRNSSQRIDSKDLEAVGESFVPEHVYETIRQLQRFSHMRRGHQQDAEEFLGILLNGLHEEAVEITNKAAPAVQTNGSTGTSTPNGTSDDSGEWMEVGQKQKAATTRHTESPESPISKIFGGKLRSELRVPGRTPSITTEPYTPLQLDIQAPEVRSVIDALKHITAPEKITADFNTSKGNVTATKQVYIDTLPPVLILHLKRFQYDNTGGTQKIWKKIAYPLDLEIPAEAMSPMRRQGPRPKYRLIGVVYHHGTSAQGGHYTVDVRRQDGKSWLRFDDTTLKRIGGDGVAVGLEELGRDEKADAWEGAVVGANGQIKENGESAKKKFVPQGRDNKVAYILFYQRI